MTSLPNYVIVENAGEQRTRASCFDIDHEELLTAVWISEEHKLAIVPAPTRHFAAPRIRSAVARAHPACRSRTVLDDRPSRAIVDPLKREHATVMREGTAVALKFGAAMSRC